MGHLDCVRRWQVSRPSPDPQATASASQAHSSGVRPYAPSRGRCTPWRSGAACSRTRRGMERTRCFLLRQGPSGGVRLDRIRAWSGRTRESARAARGGVRAERHRIAGTPADSVCPLRLAAAAAAPARTRAYPGGIIAALGRVRGEGSDRLKSAGECLGPPNAGPRRRSGSRARGGRTRAGGFRQPRPACSIRRGVLARTSALLAGCARHSRALRRILRATRFFLGRDPAGSQGDRPSPGLREFGRHADPLRRIAGLFE